MNERWQTKLRVIDHIEPSQDLLERAEAGPRLPDPGPPPAARVMAVLVAAVIAVAGGWGAFAALRSDPGVGREPAGGEDAVTGLWPETLLADARKVQEQADAGNAAVQWRTEAAYVALRCSAGRIRSPDCPSRTVPTPCPSASAARSLRAAETRARSRNHSRSA